MLKSINRSVVAMLVLALTFTACEYDDWSPYKSNAEIDAVIVSFQESIITGVQLATLCLLGS